MARLICRRPATDAEVLELSELGLYVPPPPRRGHSWALAFEIREVEPDVLVRFPYFALTRIGRDS